MLFVVLQMADQTLHCYHCHAHRRIQRYSEEYQDLRYYAVHSVGPDEAVDYVRW